MLTDLIHQLGSYSYWGVLFIMFIQGIGIPTPGPLFTAVAIYAGTTHRLSLPPLLGAAILGTLAGNTISFWIGRAGGSRLLHRPERLLRRHEDRLKRAQDALQKRGGIVVFTGRFVPVLHLWIALLAGTSSMRWSTFLLFDTLGTIGWVTLFGAGGYLLGSEINTVGGLVTVALLVLVVTSLLTRQLLLRRHGKRLAAEKEMSSEIVR